MFSKIPLEYYIFTGIFNFLTAFFLGTLLLVKSYKRIPNRLYGFFAYSVAFWSLFYFIWLLSENPIRAEFYLRTCMIGVFFMPALFVHFIIRLTDTKSREKFVLINYVIGLVLTFFVYSRLYASNIGSFFVIKYWLKAGPFFHLAVTHFSLMVIYTFYLLYKKISSSSGLFRNQLIYVFVASLIGYGGGVSNYFAWYRIPIPPVLNICVSFYVIIVTYAIVRYRIMDINLALRYTTVNFLFAIFFCLPFLLLARVVGLSYWGYLLLFVAIFITPWFFNRFREKLTSTVDLFPLFKEYKKLKELEKYQEQVAEVRTTKEWSDKLVEVTQNLFNPVSCSVLEWRQGQNAFCIGASRNLDIEDVLSIKLTLDSPVVRYLQAEKSILLKEMIAPDLSDREVKQITCEMENIFAEICVPFFMKGKLIAVLNLANRSDGNIYNDLILTGLWGLGRAAEEVLRSIIIRIEHMGDIGKLAHDLLKPFGAKGTKPYLEPLSRGEYDPEKQERVVELINDDYEFLEYNLKQFVNLDPTMKGSRYSLSPTSLTDCYERLEEKFKAEAGKQKIKLVIVKPAPELKVHCDLQAIEYRVLFNLMDNAFRYTPENGTIELGYELKDGLFVGQVRDSGKGIAKENLENIFEQGFQVDDGKKGLAGLGLAIIREVMEAHKGKVWVESPGEGKGTTFYFSIPLAV